MAKALVEAKTVSGFCPSVFFAVMRSVVIPDTPRLRLTENAPAACHKPFTKYLNYSNTLGFREFPLP
jgi:hypothetical protein